MNRTALIPLGIFLLVTIIATFVVAHYEKVFVEISDDINIEYVKNTENLNSNVFTIHQLVDKYYQEIPLNKKDYRSNIYAAIMQSKEFMAAGKFGEAENLLKTLLVFYPNNIEVMSLLTGLYCATGKYSYADDLLKKILKLEPDNSSALENRGIIFEQQKMYKNAIASFFKASLLKPDSTISYLHMARLHSVLGNNEEAMDNFKKAYELLGNKIYPFTFASAFDNIRNQPEFVVIFDTIQNVNDKNNTDIMLHKETVR